VIDYKEKVKIATSLNSALSGVPLEISDALGKEYQNIESRFIRRDWSPAELNGGRFAEAVLRYLEWKQSGVKYTPIGSQLNRQNVINIISHDPKIPDGLRFHVLTCAELLLDIRNKRDVAHLGKQVDVREMDSRLVLRLAKWTLAEIIREEASLLPKEIQQLIDNLSVKEIPLIEEIDGDILVVGKHLLAIEQALAVLYHSYPGSVEIKMLCQAVRYKNSARFRSLLEEKANDRIVLIKGDKVFLTSYGSGWVEKYINMQLKI